MLAHSNDDNDNNSRTVVLSVSAAFSFRVALH